MRDSDDRRPKFTDAPAPAAGGDGGGGPPNGPTELPSREDWAVEIEQAQREPSPQPADRGLDTPSERGRVDRRAWDKEEAFTAGANADGGARIEGWLSRPGTPRGPEDEALQRELRRAGGEHLREKTGDPAADKPRDACHLIAVDLGGPRAGTHGEELARANLVLGDERINRSYLAKAEGLMREALERHGEVYCQVDVRSRRDGSGEPSHVTHRLFTRGEDGQPAWLGEITTTIDDRPAATAGAAERGAKNSPHHKWEQ